MNEALIDATDQPLHVVIEKSEIAAARQMAVTERMQHHPRACCFSLTNKT